MNVREYIAQINSRLAQGHTSEHTFRTDLEQLLRHLLPNHNITNEPLNVTDCGNPDFIIMRDRVPIGYIEAKDVGKDLNSKSYQEQFSRYKKALDNLIITDYVWFQFFVEGKKVTEIRLGQPALDNPNKIEVSDKNTLEKFENLVKEFSTKVTQAIKSPSQLAELMAGKARLLENILSGALRADIDNNNRSQLANQFSIFRDMLIHDLEIEQFSDLYAQTLAYGMFAARYHDPALETFDRNEAARLIPKSNPLLRNLFQSIAGHNIDERIKTTVDNLADVFRHADVKTILNNFGKSTAQTDPIIHFYETFLTKYDPALRKSRGVWYTPEPVVSFIVRAVDEVLKTKFNIKDGLADTSKTTIKRQAQGTAITQGRNKGKAIYEDVEVHKVQILDPATGTGTFLAEIIKYLYQTRFQHMQGVWPSYVEEHLIPRLNGFELLMASYAMAHLKLDMLLSETGYQESKSNANNSRLRIFLTNSLEEHHPDTHTLFSQWLSEESREANAVKKDTPVMVVMGNPPYSVSSSNSGDWIQNLVQDYKKDLNERNIQPLSDDYIKFIRYGQHFIEKTGEGVLAFITNNSFIDGIIHRQMRKHLLETFDEIYILDLHGNAKKKETAPDGTKDENVFDIMQGVSINIFIKNGSKIKKQGDLGAVFKADLFGSRKSKYQALDKSCLKTILWQAVKPSSPDFLYIKQDLIIKDKYEKGLEVFNLLPHSSSGIKTHRDHFVINISEKLLKEKVKLFYSSVFSDDEIKAKLNLKDNRDWSVSKARQGEYKFKYTKKISYRPFDNQNIYYDSSLIDFGREKTIKHMLADNVGLVLVAQPQAANISYFDCVLIANNITDTNFYRRGGPFVFPLYLYPDDGSERLPNLNLDEIKAFEKALNLPFVPENTEKSFVPSCLLKPFNSSSNLPTEFTPIDILDYIYAVLHSPNYRETYKEFLKTDFPRVPYPTPETFWQLVELGDQIRLLHLMESTTLDTPITQYPVAGDNVITRKITKTSPGYDPTNDTHGKVWINDTQYFDNVPLLAWEFYIGGYQPAQKWLKDRRDRELSFDDILHYQKIIVALHETHRLMQEVDKILVLKK